MAAAAVAEIRNTVTTATQQSSYQSVISTSSGRSNPSIIYQSPQALQSSRSNANLLSVISADDRDLLGRWPADHEVPPTVQVEPACWLVETRLHGWACKTRTQKRRRKITL